MTLSAHDYLKKILTSPIYDVAVNSDLQPMHKLSAAIGHNVWLKREDQQAVKSFKLRGAYNKISLLTDTQLQAGVITASAGNHAQGVAYSAAQKQVKAVIVMPETTPEIKVEAARNFGGEYVEIVLHGINFDQASEHSKQLAAEHGYTLVPPFDDADVIAGQGTIGKEILAELPNLDVIFIAVGGGGLAAGIGVYLKQIKPSIKIVAVEAEDSACLQLALEKGQPSPLDHVGIFADGVAVKTIGSETFRLCQQYVDELITVSSDELCAAIKDIFDDTRVIAEPAGALSVAAMRKYAKQSNEQNLHMAGILCGANINFHTLRYVSERCELGEQKEAVLAISLPERKGAFKQFCELLGGRIITEFNYRYANKSKAQIFVGIRLRKGEAELTELTDQLTQAGYEWFDMSDNEMAKLHVRYMVGGRPSTLPEEKVYSFEFPEHPGALMKFLNTLGENFNISLFHYRNHGAADGLVMAGFNVEAAQQEDFSSHLSKLGYTYQEQSDNPAYQFFLSNLS